MVREEMGQSKHRGIEVRDWSWPRWGQQRTIEPGLLTCSPCCRFAAATASRIREISKHLLRSIYPCRGKGVCSRMVGFFFPLLAVNRGCLCRVGEIPACSETRHFHALACSPFNSRMHILKCRQPLAQHRYPNETVRILVNFSNCAAHKAVRSQGGFLETHAGIIFALTVTRPSLETRTHPQFTVWGFILCGCLFHHLDILGRQLCESDAWWFDLQSSWTGDVGCTCHDLVLENLFKIGGSPTVRASAIRGPDMSSRPVK